MIKRKKRKMIKRKMTIKRTQKYKREKFYHLAAQPSGPPALIPIPSLQSGAKK